MTTSTEYRPIVLKPDQLKSHDRGGGAKTIPLVSPAIGASTFINGITEFGPSAAIAFHSHNCEESVMLLEGNAVLEMEGHESVVLKKHDTTWLPANLSHRFRNLSDT
jgi:mannose-6-phosphate isomerase-like protein (cupin superfamily)